MRERHINHGIIQERMARIGMLTIIAPMSANAGARDFLNSISELHQDPLKATLLIGATAVSVVITGGSISYAIRGNQFARDLWSLINR